MVPGQWQVYIVNEVRDWIDSLDATTHTRAVQAIDTLADVGPGLGRPLVDTIHGSSITNLKELRPGTVRILFAFDAGGTASCSSPATRQAGRRSGTATRSRSLNNRYARNLTERAHEEQQR
ncbi:type II toxin-antitoxin system RelE/ParE family toxin [Pseudonocardia sp. DSM 110487]|uniref:type II toxin-antitoxin system RelE/ParE family toxin n=1 Tax=Pseudonocardia sp. DSM 110487 TaxID=2865833 RepID=UPI00351D6CBD